MLCGINIVSAPIYGNLLLTATLQRLVWWILVWLYSVCIDQVPWLAAHYLRYVNATGAVSFNQITIESSTLISNMCSSRPTMGETEHLGLLWMSVNCLNSYVKGIYKLRGPRWYSGLGAVLQIGRSLVRFQMVSLEFFIDIILPIEHWPWDRLSL